MAASEINFLAQSNSYCVCFVDIVNSTGVTAGLSDEQVRNYYSIFLNNIATIIKSFDAKVLKVVGDGVIFFMPNTINCENLPAFDNALNCCFALLTERHFINAALNAEGLPPVSYRISADYGRFQIAKTKSSRGDDLFGSTMNLCAKINSLAKPNSMIIGNDLHLIACKSRNYHFAVAGSYSIEMLKQKYSVYSVLRKSLSQEQIESDARILRMKNMNIGKQSSNAFAKIIIVDDEPDILMTFRDILAKAGYQSIETCSDPIQLLQTFAKSQAQKYDLIILDIRMPKMNGLQLFKRLYSIDSNLKVLFATALDAVDELISVLPEIKRENVLRKPVNNSMLTQKVEALLCP